VDGERDRAARLRELAGVMIGMRVRGVEVRSSGGSYPVGYPDLYLVPPPGMSPSPGWDNSELRLRVITHGWRVESRGQVLAAPKDPPGGLGDAAGVLAGRTVTGLAIDFPGPDTMLSFGDLRLRIFPVSTIPAPDGIQAWLLRTAPDCLLVVGPDGDWGISRGRRRSRQANA
jgi:hypothetical protein